MTYLLHDALTLAAARTPGAIALRHRGEDLAYAACKEAVDRFAGAILSLGIERQSRVAIFLPKRFEAVIAMFGAARAGCVFVPINPVLKPAQVRHILCDCNARILVTASDRLGELRSALEDCKDLDHAIVVDDAGESTHSHFDLHRWRDLGATDHGFVPHRMIDADVAAILYTSGSTGKPKGVVLSHRNLVAGAQSVAQYLDNRADDRLLAVLPFSFDYGFSQLTTAFEVGAQVVLLDHLFPKDVVTAVAKERITGLAGVPPLWSQLAELQWPQDAGRSLRYFTNSGGALQRATLEKLRATLPNAKPFLMYGLTEAFRSTYLAPEEIDTRMGSIGKAIPNAEVLVVRPDGTPCAPNEPGELVHRGALVSLGYWNDPEKTAERFKPAPNRDPSIPTTEIAVWSGDTVRADEDGFLYFMGRRDEMIKTSGYRVSPTEIEEVLFATGLVSDAVAFGVVHPTLGQAIVVVASGTTNESANVQTIWNACRAQLPAFMVPLHVELRPTLPRNPNGKYDRAALAAEFKGLFTEIAP